MKTWTTVGPICQRFNGSTNSSVRSFDLKLVGKYQWYRARNYHRICFGLPGANPISLEPWKKNLRGLTTYPLTPPPWFDRGQRFNVCFLLTRPSRTCVIQEYRYYTMSLSQYHESKFIPWVCVNTISPRLYHESMSIPWVNVSTMSPCLYLESMSKPWVHAYTRSPCLYHDSMSLPWVHVCTISPFLCHESMSITWVLVKSMRLCPYHWIYNFQK